MKFFFNYVETNQRIVLDIEDNQTVKDIKNILEEKFKLDTSSNGSIIKRIALEYCGSDLKNEWILVDLSIPIGSTIRCCVKNEKIHDFSVHLKFQRDTIHFFDTGFDLDKCYVLELKVFLSQYFGFPLSIFRLKSESNMVLYDENLLSIYKLPEKPHFLLETWKDWDNFLKCSINGYSQQVFKYLSPDEYIKQFQLRVALHLASHYGNFELAKTLVLLGTKPDRPVGEHPCRQWCQYKIKPIDEIDKSNRLDVLKLEYLKCPIHVAVVNGQLKVLNLFSKMNIYVLEKKDGFGFPPWRLSLHNDHRDPIKKAKQKDVARYLLSKQFGGKVKLTDSVSISIHLFSKVKSWIERSREKVLFKHGIGKTSLKKRIFLDKGGLLGNKVLVDGYNNNFKESVNSYQRLRSDYKFYYFIDQNDQDKHGYPDLYFKTVGLMKPMKPINFSKKKDEKDEKDEKDPNSPPVPDRPPPKTLPLWKKAVNTILFRKTIKQYADVLIQLGVEIDLDELDLGEADNYYEIKKAEEKRKNSRPELGKRKKSTLKSASSTNKIVQKLPVKMSDGKVKNLALAKNKNSSVTNPPKMDNKFKSESLINFEDTDKKENKQKNVKVNSKEIYDATVTYFEEQYNKVKKEKQKDTVFISTKDLRNETMKIFDDYRHGFTPRQNAKSLIKDVSSFKSKSWLQQIYLASDMAKGNAKRLIQKSAQLRLSSMNLSENKIENS